MSSLYRPWRVLIVLALSSSIIIAVLGNPYGLAAVKAALIVPEIFVDMPVHPMEWIGSPSLESEVSYSDAPGTEASLYRPPDDGRHAAMVVALGAVVPGTRFDPRVVRLAENTARAGVVMLVVESDYLNQDLVVQQDIERLIDAFQYLSGQEFVDPDRVGFASFSAGAALALLAAADPRINDRVDFVLAYGTYYDLRNLIYSVTTRRIVYNGVEEPWQPRRKTVTVLTRSIIATLPDPDEQAALFSLLPRSANSGPTDASLDALSPDARAFYRLLTNDDPARVPALLDQVSPERLAILDSLSPSSAVHDLKARLFIIATKDDNLIPYVESRRLRDAVAARGGAYHYAELSIFQHVDVALTSNFLRLFLDLVKLYIQLYWITLAVT